MGLRESYKLCPLQGMTKMTDSPPGPAVRFVNGCLLPQHMQLAPLQPVSKHGGKEAQKKKEDTFAKAQILCRSQAQAFPDKHKQSNRLELGANHALLGAMASPNSVTSPIPRVLPTG